MTPAYLKLSGWGAVLWLVSVNLPLAAANQPSVLEADAVPTPQTLIEINSRKVIRDSLPDTFFGFNIRWTRFQKDLWDEQHDRVKPRIIDALQPFTGALYRYPGGLVANEFHWEPAALPMEKRKSINKVRSKGNELPLFGVQEFFDFTREVKGNPLYTLNIVGEGKPSKIVEYPADEVAASNRALAEYVKTLTPERRIHYYQLGNELDRNRYQWSHEKYVARSLASIQAVQEVDPDARFIAFLREFNWRYRWGKHGKSDSEDLIRDVLTGLPMVNDYSLHFYYDGEIKKGGWFMHIQDVVSRIRRTLNVAGKVREGKPLKVWITEHSRRMLVDSGNEQEAKFLTTNLEAALSTADFLSAMTQIPQVQGTALQALNGVGRQTFDASVRHGDLRPRPVYWAMRILNVGRTGAVLSTKTKSTDSSGYPGGYDVRAVALADGPDQLAVWIVNRAAGRMTADIVYDPFKGQSVEMKHYYLAGKSGVKADDVGDDYRLALEPEPQELGFSERGVIQVGLPPSSVSTFMFRKKAVGEEIAP